ncbi:uncharacterized protein [Symphalangus syndactylus]|uniref:uncharacterized protein n=1 Tax=Symphalangus syndactylus TaxID=9590 RepID=UPI0024412F8B|nr:uncharacterized protein LOC129476871 [Symphalangus syndactylus]
MAGSPLSEQSALVSLSTRLCVSLARGLKSCPGFTFGKTEAPRGKEAPRRTLGSRASRPPRSSHWTPALSRMSTGLLHSPRAAQDLKKGEACSISPSSSSSVSSRLQAEEIRPPGPGRGLLRTQPEDAEDIAAGKPAGLYPAPQASARLHRLPSPSLRLGVFLYKMGTRSAEPHLLGCIRGCCSGNDSAELAAKAAEGRVPGPPTTRPELTRPWCPERRGASETRFLIWGFPPEVSSWRSTLPQPEE